MSKQRGSLANFTSVKSHSPAPKDDSNPPPVKKDSRKGQTLRLSPEAWKQLKILSVEQESTMHALLLDAVNDLFKKHGKKPIE